MPTDEELLDEEEPRRLTHVIYNTALGHVRIRAEDSLTTTVEVPAGEVRFRRVVGAAEPEVALWLGSVERTFLGRMLDHVLSALRITPEARAALEAVRQKLDELGPPPIVASEGDDGALAEAPPSILEEPRAPDGPTARAPALAAGRRRGRTRPPTPAPTPEVASPAAPPAPEEPSVEAPPREFAPQAPSPVPAGATAALAAEAPAGSPAPSAPAVGITFETVWRDLQALRVQGPSLHALAGQASSEIREVVPDGVWLYSHGLGREYFIPRDLLEGPGRRWWPRGTSCRASYAVG